MSRLASGFSTEIEFGLDRTQNVPLISRATFKKGYVGQHSDFNKAVHSSKRSKNTVCKAKLSVKIKPITANTRAKDKYVKVGMINIYSSWLGAIAECMFEMEICCTVMENYYVRGLRSFANSLM
jgi:hypothetical protein